MIRTTTIPASHTPCAYCGSTGSPWDVIAGAHICPDCQETLVRGEGEPLKCPLVGEICVVCGWPYTVPYLTVPIHWKTHIAIDLCSRHFRAFLGRRLEPAEYRKLRRGLDVIGLEPGKIFLLHEAFYSNKGKCVQPIEEA